MDEIEELNHTIDTLYQLLLDVSEGVVDIGSKDDLERALKARGIPLEFGTED